MKIKIIIDRKENLLITDIYIYKYEGKKKKKLPGIEEF